MNAGSLMRVTSTPFKSPNPAHAPKPSRMDTYGLTPLSTASFVMTIIPNAITRPHERSMPAVRTMSVCPIASVPTSTDCWRMSERFGPRRNRFDSKEKNATASRSAANGPSVARPPRRPSARRACERADTTCTLFIISVAAIAS